MRRKLISGGLLATTCALIPTATSGVTATQALRCGLPGTDTACSTVRFVYENACDTPLVVGPSTEYFVVEPNVKCAPLQMLVTA